ncbi:hypothetical protein [Neisseria chenwenguii]|uniref:Uncharacterized protein n=1 Tax=Neisseria chenwenguii TaxID=1853278 RepID=A0A220S1P7_9NEIS|nr:hypothetical protein [Neisseria chenwenguii]ASK27367.1 hypothetical protein BG910_06095 [Neisseria chenwenguii]ROV56961.1 hypothetical protein EGS38_02095 [Neisseria chenwenguii]
MLKKFAAGIVVLGLAGQVAAANWVNVGGDSEATIWIDTESMAHNQIWTQWRYKKPQKLEGKNPPVFYSKYNGIN